MTCDDSLPAAVIKKRRVALGLDHTSVAVAMGINRPSYYDLEAVDTEIWTCVDVVEVFRLCRVLKLTPEGIFRRSASYFEEEFVKSVPSFGASPLQIKSPMEGLASLRPLIANTLVRTGESISQFEDRVGWGGLQDFLADKVSGLNWNVNCLACVCKGCGADWLAVLQNEFDSGDRERPGILGDQ